jgi:hypothetical protein
VGYYNRETKVYEVYPAEVAMIREWLENRGGLAVWNCHDLSDPCKMWTTPAKTKDGQPTPKPHWAAGEVIATITDPASVIVTVPREVKRFHVAVRLGGNDLKVELTDGSSSRVRAATEKAERDTGKEAWHVFDYERQDAIIYVQGDMVPLKDWKRPADVAPQSEVRQ